MRRWAAFAVLVGLPADQPPAPAALDHVLTWTVEHADFGGFSAIELTGDGRNFMALTDQGVLFAGVFDRLPDGRIALITCEPPMALTDENGIRLDEDRNDTEGLALRGDGSFLVSLEGPAEVLDYPRLGAPARALPRLPRWKGLGMNAGIEALAVDSMGPVLAIPEAPGNGFFSAHAFTTRRWTEDRAFRAGDGFRAVAADFGPDGRLYLLERRFVFPGGFASRLRRFTEIGQVGAMVWSSPPGRHGNLEGLAIWRNPSHGLTATMISDDNFLSLLQTQLVEIAIGD